MKISEFYGNMSKTGADSLQQASTRDSTNFSSMVNGGSNVAKMEAETVLVGQRAAEHMMKSTQQKILMNVVDQKNAMLLESRGSSAKKTTEISKEIGF